MKKIKKSLAGVLVLCLMAFLCGCSGYRETNSQYIVSMIALSEGEEITLSVEAFYSDQMNDETIKRHYFTARGATVREAYYHLENKTTAVMLLDHCSAIVLDNTAKSSTIEQLFSFCEEEKQLNLAVQIITVSNVNDLENIEPFSGAVGFNFATAVRQQSENIGIKYHNKFYAAQRQRATAGQIYTVPYFELADGKVDLCGEYIFQNFRNVCYLNEQETLMYAMLCNLFSSGNIMVGDQTVTVQKCQTKTKAALKNDRLNISFAVTLSLKNTSPKMVQNLERQLRDFVRTMPERSRVDVFACNSVISEKQSDLWAKIEKQYDRFYQEADFLVNCKEQKL